MLLIIRILNPAISALCILYGHVGTAVLAFHLLFPPLPVYFLNIFTTLIIVYIPVLGYGLIQRFYLRLIQSDILG